MNRVEAALRCGPSVAFGFVSGLLSVALAVFGISHQVRRLSRSLLLYFWRRTHGFIFVGVSFPLIIVVIGVVVRRAIRAPKRPIIKRQRCVVKSEPEANAAPAPTAVTSVISVASSIPGKVPPASEMTAAAMCAAAASSRTPGGEDGLAPTKGSQ